MDRTKLEGYLILSTLCLLIVILLALINSGCHSPCANHTVPNSRGIDYDYQWEMILPQSGVPVAIHGDGITAEALDERLVALKDRFPAGRWDCLEILITDKWRWSCENDRPEGRQQLLLQPALNPESCSYWKGFEPNKDCPCHYRGVIREDNDRVLAIFPPQASVLELYLESYLRNIPVMNCDG